VQSKSRSRVRKARPSHHLAGQLSDGLFSANHALVTLFTLPEYQAARRVSVYLSMPGGEIATAGIVKDAFERGKGVFIPYTYKRSTPTAGQPLSIMDMLQLQSLEDYESFKPDKWGIPTAPEASIAQRLNSFGDYGRSEGSVSQGKVDNAGLDLIVMPGMAFDEGYGRLGHGKGFYDFFLQRCHEYTKHDKDAKMPFLGKLNEPFFLFRLDSDMNPRCTVGLALQEQILPPTESVPMDATDWRLDALIAGDGSLLRRSNV